MGAYRSGVTYDEQIGLTTVAAALTDVDVTYALLQSDPANTVNILFGSSGSQNMVLAPGATVSMEVSNLKVIWAKAASGTPNLNVFALR